MSEKQISPAENSRAYVPYRIEEINGIEYPHSVLFSFELLYLDWCKFQKSDLFAHLIRYLEELQTQENRPLRQENPN